MFPDHTVTPDEIRRSLRELLNDVEHEGEHVTISRYGKAAAIIVPVEWYLFAKTKLGDDPALNRL